MSVRVVEHDIYIFSVNDETKFTKKPQDTVYARLGSDVVFQWAWVFGDAQDWTNFEQIIWGGETDKHGNIGNKYITIGNDLKLWFNPSLPDYVKSRANWTGTVSRAGCRQKFILRNVTRLDETTYGCTAVMYGETIKSGPIRLVVLSK